MYINFCELKGDYKDCQKSTGDKTWDVSEIHEIGHWEHHRNNALFLVILSNHHQSPKLKLLCTAALLSSLSKREL